MDDMDEANGALAVVPGSHREGRHVTLALGPEGYRAVAGREPRADRYERVLLPMRRGGVAYVHGRTLHGSGPNRSDRPRRALVVHAMSGASRLAESSWIQPPPGGFDVLAAPADDASGEVSSSA
jgi:ectoine hydroxylase-related dioxygenase (phytanoyl-CoA dioxygenase family)